MRACGCAEEWLPPLAPGTVATGNDYRKRLDSAMHIGYGLLYCRITEGYWSTRAQQGNGNGWRFYVYCCIDRFIDVRIIYRSTNKIHGLSIANVFLYLLAEHDGRFGRNCFNHGYEIIFRICENFGKACFIVIKTLKSTVLAAFRRFSVTAFSCNFLKSDIFLSRAPGNS